MELNEFATITLLLIAGSSLTNAVTYEQDRSPMPTQILKYQPLQMTSHLDGRIVFPTYNNLEIDQYDTIIAFASDLVSNTKDMDRDLQKYVDDIFWDLI